MSEERKGLFQDTVLSLYLALAFYDNVPLSDRMI